MKVGDAVRLKFRWVAGWLARARGLAAESALREWIVSSRVNRTDHGDDDPTIVEPVAAVS